MILTLAACTDTAAPDPAVLSPATASAAKGPAPAAIPEWLDTDFVNLARTIPGYGGHHFHADGTTTLYLTNPGNSSVAVARLRHALATRFRGTTVPLTGEIKVERADFKFLDLTQWRMTTGRLLAGQGVLSLLGTDKSANRVFVGVRDAAMLEPVREQLIEAGVPLRALDLSVVSIDYIDPGPGGGGGGSTGSNPTLADFTGSLMGGYEITTDANIEGKRAACTLGLTGDGKGFANAPYTPLYGTYGIVSSHCTPSYTSVSGFTDFYQPRSDFIGSEFADGFPQDPHTQFCGFGIPCRHSDMAMIEITGRGIAEGEIAPAKSGSIEINPGQPSYKVTLRSVVRRYPPAPVEIVGARSGYSSGQVVQHCFDGFRTDSNGDEIVFVCQQVASYNSSSGDSGAPVFSPDTRSQWSHYDRASIWEGTHHASVVDQNTGKRYGVYSPLIGFDMDLKKQCERGGLCYGFDNVDWFYQDSYYGVDY